MTNQKTARQNAVPMYIAATVCAACVIFMIVAFSIPKEGVKGEFTPPAFDAAAQAGVPEVPSELGWFTPTAEGLSMKVSVCGEVIIKDGKADIYFTNHGENSDWMLVRILDGNGNILAESGIIKPGEYVKTIKFDTVPQNGATIVYKIMAYEPETYYSAGTITLSTYAQIGE